MSPTITPEAAVALEEQFVVPVDFDTTELELVGARRCCGCTSGACLIGACGHCQHCA